MKRELPAGTLWAFRLIAFGLPLLIGGLITIVVMIKFRFLVRDDDGNMALQRPIYLQEPDHEVSGHQYLYDSALGWRNIPGYNASTRGRELKINARGLRDREEEPADGDPAPPGRAGARRHEDRIGVLAAQRGQRGGVGAVDLVDHQLFGDV